MFKTAMSKVSRLLLVFPLITCFTATFAATEQGTTINVTGTLIDPPPCFLNEEQPLEVNFGDKVGIKKVATGIYRQPLDIEVRCEESSKPWQLVISWYGNTATFDADNATIITAEQADLGVKLYADGKAFPLKTLLNVNAMALPKLEAVLVQREGIELKEGVFTARGILRAEYQ